MEIDIDLKEKLKLNYKSNNDFNNILKAYFLKPIIPKILDLTKSDLIEYLLLNYKCEYLKTYFDSSIEEGNYSSIKENLYINFLSNLKSNNIKYINLQPYELCKSGESYFLGDGCKYYTKLNYYKTNIKFPVLTDNTKLYLPIDTYKINTMFTSIKIAKGNVLCLGIDNGYFPFMSSFNEEIKEMTIVENDSFLINFLKNNLSRKITQNCKLNIINESPLEFLKSIKDAQFTYIFVNKELSIDDYIQYKKILENIKFTSKVIYNESFLITEIIDNFISIILDKDCEIYSKNPIFLDFKKQTIKSIADYRESLSVSNIINLIKNL